MIHKLRCNVTRSKSLKYENFVFEKFRKCLSNLPNRHCRLYLKYSKQKKTKHENGRYLSFIQTAINFLVPIAQKLIFLFSMLKNETLVEFSDHFEIIIFFNFWVNSIISKGRHIEYLTFLNCKSKLDKCIKNT